MNKEQPYPEIHSSSSVFQEDSLPSNASQPTGLNYNLEERTAKFGEAIILFAKKIPPNPANSPLISQIVRCGTSIGANYVEADDAVSKKEFINKIGISRKEARETKFFLRMVAAAEPGLKYEARDLWCEAKQLHLIFSKIFRSGRKNLNSQ